MERFLARRRWAIVCALLVPLCWVVIRPVANVGIIDDWSYTAMVDVLARTGKYAYNGWATAMVGVLAYAAAALVKLFGFSYTVVRSTVVIAAAATGYACQRLLVRLGLSEGNAALVTLAVLFSITLLPMCFLFMTDVPGLLGIVLCLYACVRAVQAHTNGGKPAWLITAMLVAVIGGTCRQTVWLAGLTMVPSTLWLLRRRRHVLVTGGIALVLGTLLIAGCFHWLNHVEFFRPDGPLPAMSLHDATVLPYVTVHALPTMLFLTMPVLAAYLTAVPWRDRRVMTVAGMMVAILLLVAGVEIHRGRFGPWMEAYLDGNVVLGGLFLAGRPPHELSHLAGGLLLLLAVLCTVAFLTVCWKMLRQRRKPVTPVVSAISWKEMAVLLLPFSTLYVLAIVPRAISQGGIQNRYLVPIALMAMIAAARLFQERVRKQLGWISVLIVLATGVFAVIGTHDGFARHRAELDAATKLRHAGVPADQIDGGGEYDGEVQIARYGFVNDPRTTIPAGITRPTPKPESMAVCEPFLDHAKLFPAVTPVYVLASDPDACGGKASYAPVPYGTWLPPHDQAIYVVHATR